MLEATKMPLEKIKKRGTRVFYIFYTSLLIVAIILSGCITTTKEQPFVVTDVHTGTEGLALDFAKNMPPDDITDKVTFQVGIEVRNLGTEDIKKGYLTLLDFYPEQMVIKDDNKTKIFDIEGKSIYNPEGGYDMLAFTIQNNGLPIQERTEANFLFKAIACYKYRTVASVDVCVKPRNFGISDLNSNCETGSVQAGQGQGGPVAITKVEDSIVPNTDDRTNITTYTGVYKILIENKGGGYLADPSDYEKPCTESYKKENTLKNENIQVEMSGKLLTCTPVSGIKDSNSFYIVCNADFGELKDSYTTPLSVTMDYGYISPEVEKSVFVKKVSQNTICQAGKCKENGYGVCDLYGGENVDGTPSCPKNQKCCYESAERCTRDFGQDGYACRQKSGCDDVTIIQGYCPGGGDIVCCKAK
jgi:hypothetical protein